jgi:hypothetical protein
VSEISEFLEDPSTGSSNVHGILFGTLFCVLFSKLRLFLLGKLEVVTTANQGPRRLPQIEIKHPK